MNPFRSVFLLVGFVAMALMAAAAGDQSKVTPRPPPYRIGPPDILIIEVNRALTMDKQEISGQHLVGPDGAVRLGIYGSVPVAGMTVEEARSAVAQHLATRIKGIKPDDLFVDMLGYNSKHFYVLAENVDGRDKVSRYLSTGNETVLDALAQVGTLPRLSGKKIWIRRPSTEGEGKSKILSVDWSAITRGTSMATNYPILAGDLLVIADNKDGK